MCSKCHKQILVFKSNPPLELVFSWGGWVGVWFTIGISSIVICTGWSYLTIHIAVNPLQKCDWYQGHIPEQYGDVKAIFLQVVCTGCCTAYHNLFTKCINHNFIHTKCIPKFTNIHPFQLTTSSRKTWSWAFKTEGRKLIAWEGGVIFGWYGGRNFCCCLLAGEYSVYACLQWRSWWQ